MSTRIRTGALAAAGIVAGLACVQSASAQVLDVLLEVDLTVENQVTITATSGVSAATVAGSNFTGVYLADFYNGPQSVGLSAGLVAGDLTSFLNPPDNSPALFRGAGAGGDPGLNIWSFSTQATVNFEAEVQAFVGSATWNLSPAAYADMLAGNTSGLIYFPADTFDDIPGAQVLGSYVVIPTPGALAMFGLSFGACAIRRRR